MQISKKVRNSRDDLGTYEGFENLKFNDLYSYSSLRLDLKQLEAGVFVLLALILGAEHEYLVSGHAHPLVFGRFEDQLHELVGTVFQVSRDLIPDDATGHVNLADHVAVG